MAILWVSNLHHLPICPSNSFTARSSSVSDVHDGTIWTAIILLENTRNFQSPVVHAPLTCYWNFKPIVSLFIYCNLSLRATQSTPFKFPEGELLGFEGREYLTSGKRNHLFACVILLWIFSVRHQSKGFSIVIASPIQYKLCTGRCFACAIRHVQDPVNVVQASSGTKAFD